MVKKDGRVVARDNEFRVLRALHRFGWLRTRDVAALIWKHWASNATSNCPSLNPSQPTTAGLRMGQRTLRRLREKRLVLSAKAPDGSTIYSLSEAGARSLQGVGVTAAASGKDQVRSFSSGHFRHRCISNEIAIAAIIQGFRASSEREIAQGLWLGGQLGIAGKRPDVLIRSGAILWWIEVERSRKNGKDYARLLNWLEVIKRDALAPHGTKLFGGKWTLGKVVFVCTTAFEGKLCRDLEAIGWSRKHIDSFLIFKTLLYKVEDIVFS